MILSKASITIENFEFDCLQYILFNKLCYQKILSILILQICV